MARVTIAEELQAIHDTRAKLRRQRSRSDSLSVVVATRRPDDLSHLLTYLYHQTLPTFSVHLGLHGFDLDSSLKQRVNKLRNRNIDVTYKTFQTQETLGSILTNLAKSCRGKFISKMDDDDIYGPEHLHDLLDSITHHRCEVVGRAMNYIYLEPIDMTIRRAHGSGVTQFELFSDWVCGGTIMVERSAAEKAGWFGTGTTAVDTFLLNGVKRNGGKIWRTFGAGYVYRRRQGDHTYNTNFAKYLNGSAEQWVGIR
jgi:hypothetical protein